VGASTSQTLWASTTSNNRQQRQHDLRQDMSSPAQTLGSWARIPLEAWMPSFVLYLCYPVRVTALRRADPPSKESYKLSTRFIISELVNSKWAQVRQPNGSSSSISSSSSINQTQQLCKTLPEICRSRPLPDFGGVAPR
jgi:hypothetical protein